MKPKPVTRRSVRERFFPDRGNAGGSLIGVHFGKVSGHSADAGRPWRLVWYHATRIASLHRLRTWGASPLGDAGWCRERVRRWPIVAINAARLRGNVKTLLLSSAVFAFTSIRDLTHVIVPMKHHAQHASRASRASHAKHLVLHRPHRPHRLHRTHRSKPFCFVVGVLLPIGCTTFFFLPIALALVAGMDEYRATSKKGAPRLRTSALEGKEWASGLAPSGDQWEPSARIGRRPSTPVGDHSASVRRRRSQGP